MATPSTPNIGDKTRTLWLWELARQRAALAHTSSTGLLRTQLHKYSAAAQKAWKNQVIRDPNRAPPQCPWHIYDPSCQTSSWIKGQEDEQQTVLIQLVEEATGQIKSCWRCSSPEIRRFDLKELHSQHINTLQWYGLSSSLIFCFEEQYRIPTPQAGKVSFLC